MLTATTKENTLIIEVNKSRMDMVIARTFQDELNLQIESQPKFIVLDLGKAEYFDSSAMGVLVAFQKVIKNYGGKLVLCNLSRGLLTLFKLSRLDTLFEFSDNIDKNIF